MYYLYVVTFKILGSHIPVEKMFYSRLGITFFCNEVWINCLINFLHKKIFI